MASTTGAPLDLHLHFELAVAASVGSVAKLQIPPRLDILPVNTQTAKRTMMDFKGNQFERDIILWGVRWYGVYPISYRQLEEMMQERGVDADSSLNRWVLKYTPVLDQVFRQRKRPVGASWRMDETYISVKGQWKYVSSRRQSGTHC